LANNKLLTLDNQVKRIHVPDLSCLFCSERKTVNHLFFDCLVAKIVLSTISDQIGVCVGTDFESVARCWLSNNKNSVINLVCTAALWSLWELQNDPFPGKGVATHARSLEKGGYGTGSMENSFQGCSGGVPVREGKITGQETGRGAEDSMELKVIIPSAEDWAGISSKEFADR
jgi:hypothetical protein